MTSVFKTTGVALAIALAATSAVASTSGTDPLDFSYQIAGGAKVRPALVFNDGIDTFIQPNPETESEITVKGADAEWQGPYLVIRGVVAEFKIVTKKNGAVTVTYAAPRKPAIQRPSAMAQGPLQSGSMAAAPATPGADKSPHEVVASAPVQGKDDRKVSGASVPKANADEPPTKGSVDTATRDKAIRAAAEVKAEPKGELCKPRIDVKESAYVVMFAPRAGVLTKGSLERLRTAIGDVESVVKVRAHVEAADGDRKLADQRSKTIGEALRSFGIPDQNVQVSTRDPLGYGSEIRVEHGRPAECEMPVGTVAVSGENRQKMSFGANADAQMAIGKIAQHAGLAFKTVGNTKSIPVKLVVRDKSLVDILQSIGSELGNSADLILRDAEIVLQYPEKK